MSQAPNASFFIVNKKTTSDGKLLAATYTGDGDDVTALKFANLDSQVWILAPYGDGTTQTISPKNSSKLVAGTKGGGDYTVRAISAEQRHNWYIKGTLGTYTIEDVGGGNLWYIKEAIEGQDIHKGKVSTKLSDWELVLA